MLLVEQQLTESSVEGEEGLIELKENLSQLIQLTKGTQLSTTHMHLQLHIYAHIHTHAHTNILQQRVC